MTNKKIEKIAVLTSGGDAPGMNAAIRAVVRAGHYYGMKVIGIIDGYQGLLRGEIVELRPRSVGEILSRGGTMLGTARCKEMMTEEGQHRAANIIKVLGIDALVVIGGDGSLTGGVELAKLGVNIIGIPGTIDLDLPCTDYTIGFDTAVNTCMEAVNKIRDTSSSHSRCSVIEVMGNRAGHLALWGAITGGAEEAVIPELKPPEVDDLVRGVIENRSKGKKNNLIIVAEGVGGTDNYAKKIQEITGVESRSTILGHLQRGGAPTAVDRMHASMMGLKAIQYINEGLKNIIVIYKNGKYDYVDLAEGLQAERKSQQELYEAMKILSI